MYWPQDPKELADMLGVIREIGATRIMEIGSRNGCTLREMAHATPAGSRIVSLDLPMSEGHADELFAVADELMREGYDTTVVVGDSHADEVRRSVQALGPFDFILIDGDHSYEGVKQDWLDYGDLAPVVAFHDIAAGALEKPHFSGDPSKPGYVMGVTRFWNEIAPDFKTREFIHSIMGIGVIWR